MELNKRIKALTDIQSVTNGCHDWEFMTKKGYFANSIFDFKDLKRTCVYGEYAGWREHNQCFLCEQAGDKAYFSYFLPEDSLLPEEKPEKKYRPYSLREFLHKFKFGGAIYIRPKNSKTNEERMVIFSEYRTELYKDESNNAESVCLTWMEHHKSVVCLGMREYNLTTLFDCYEYFDGKEWQPFGIEVKEEECETETL